MDASGSWSYADLLGEAIGWRDALRAARVATAEMAGADRPAAITPGDRVACLIPPGRDHVAVQLGIWLAGIAITAIGLWLLSPT